MRSTADWNIILGVLLAICLIIIADFKCNGGKKNLIDTDTVTVVEYDTAYVQVQSKPKLIYKEYRTTDTIHDTVQVVIDYNTAKLYVDSIKDSTFTAVITDTLYRNSITYRKVNMSVVNKNTTTIITNTVEKQIKYQLGLGANTNFQSITPNLILKKQNNLYSIGYTIPNKQVQIGFGKLLFTK